jgi:hypothetical protein
MLQILSFSFVEILSICSNLGTAVVVVVVRSRDNFLIAGNKQ